MLTDSSKLDDLFSFLHIDGKPVQTNSALAVAYCVVCFIIHLIK
jgi:hypothetical protein